MDGATAAGNPIVSVSGEWVCVCSLGFLGTETLDLDKKSESHHSQEHGLCNCLIQRSWPFKGEIVGKPCPWYTGGKHYWILWIIHIPAYSTLNNCLVHLLPFYMGTLCVYSVWMYSASHMLNWTVVSQRCQACWVLNRQITTSKLLECKTCERQTETTSRQAKSSHLSVLLSALQTTVFGLINRCNNWPVVSENK